jgi:hypothetical protein
MMFLVLNVVQGVLFFWIDSRKILFRVLLSLIYDLSCCVCAVV